MIDKTDVIGRIANALQMGMEDAPRSVVKACDDALEKDVPALHAELERLRKIKAAAKLIDQWEWTTESFNSHAVFSVDITEMVEAHKNLSAALAGEEMKWQMKN